MLLHDKSKIGLGQTEKVTQLLLVDDEASILRSLCRLFRREPYEIRTASTGEEALALMEELPADVVVSDYRMPGMVGTELLENICNRWPDTIRIILSGYSEVTAILSAINRGQIYKYLTKPWNDEELKLHLRRAVESRRLQMDNERLTKQLKRQNELLYQRYADCEIGLGFAQRLMESIAAAVVCIDETGLVVYANQTATTLLSGGQGEFVGMPKESVLPDGLLHALAANVPEGRLVHEGHVFLWRRCEFTSAGRLATIVTLFVDSEGKVW